MKAILLGRGPVVWALVSLLATISAQADETGHAKRWAVVSSSAIQDLGLADLLTAKLSELNGVELVERDRLADATRELKLSELMGAGDVGSRLKLGALLGADVLVFLTLEAPEAKSGQLPQARGRPPQEQNKEDDPIVRVVISECDYGLRLHTTGMKWKPDEADKIANRIRELSEAIGKRYADGIKQVVAISPFISRDLAATHQHLQQGFRHVLEQALFEYPGLALVEIDEAHQLAVELNRTAAERKRSPVPMLFVEGEFSTVDSEQTPPLLTAKLVVREPAKVHLNEEFARSDATEIAERLASKTAPAIAQIAKLPSIAPQTPKQQAATLNQRAKEFSDIGDYKTSIPQREAAILLDPRNFDLRMDILVDLHRYRFDYSSAIVPITSGPLLGKQKLDANKSREHDVFIASTGRRHTLDCFRLKLINLREAIILSRYGSGGVSKVYEEKPSPAKLAQLGRELRRYMRHYNYVAIMARSLDHRTGDGLMRIPLELVTGYKPNESPLNRTEQRDAWHTEIIERVVTIRYAFPPTPHSVAPEKPFPGDRMIVDALAGIVTKLIEPDEPPPTQAVKFLMPYMYLRGEKGKSGSIYMHSTPNLFHHPLGEELEQELIDRLKKSELPNNHFLADCFQVWVRVHRTDLDKQNRSPLPEIARLTKIAKQRHYSPDIQNRLKTLEDFVKQASDAAEQREKARKLADQTRPKRKPVAPSQDYTMKAAVWTKRRDPNPRVRFVPVEWIVADWEGLRACGVNCDVMWNKRDVWVMEAPGDVRQILRFRKENEIINLEWDGKNIWIMTVKGLYVVNTDGAIVAKIPFDDKLPYQVGNTTEYSKPLLIALAAERLLLATAYGEQKRAYVALIERGADGEYAPKMIYTAMRQPVPSSFGSAKDDSLDVAHPLTWHVRCSDPRTNRPIILIGRSVAGRHIKPKTSDGRTLNRILDENSFCRPLVVDLETLAVDVFPCKPRFILSRQSHCDNVYFHDNAFYAVLGAPILKFEATVRNGNVEFRETSLLDEHRDGFDRAQWLRHENYLYSPGAQWGRVDLNTGKYELLSSVQLPEHHRYGNYSVSAHYGLVAWNKRAASPPESWGYNWVDYNSFNRDHRGTLFQVRIDTPLDTPVELEHVPIEHRSRHADAVASLRKLGARVTIDDETNAFYELPGPKKSWIPPDRIYDLAPVVTLTKKWKGKDRDLLLINDLYGSVRLFVHGAKLNNDSLEYLAKLERLNFLGLYDLRCDDEGLKHLADAHNLRSLELSGPTGFEFTATGLKHLRNLPLERMLLSGQGFDDAAAKELMNFSKLTKVTFRDDSLSKSAETELRTRKMIVDR